MLTWDNGWPVEPVAPLAGNNIFRDFTLITVNRLTGKPANLLYSLFDAPVNICRYPAKIDGFNSGYKALT
jgi:hypothetical protein